MAQTYLKLDERLQKKLNKKLEKLGNYDEIKDAIDNGVVKGSEIVSAAIKAKLSGRERTGQLRKSIGFKKIEYRDNETIIAVIGARRGFKVIAEDGPHDPANIAHLVEFGHGGKHAAPPHPFMRPGFDSSKNQAQKMAMNSIWKNIKKMANK